MTQLAVIIKELACNAQCWLSRRALHLVRDAARHAWHMGMAGSASGAVQAYMLGHAGGGMQLEQPNSHGWGCISWGLWCARACGTVPGGQSGGGGGGLGGLGGGGDGGEGGGGEGGVGGGGEGGVGGGGEGGVGGGGEGGVGGGGEGGLGGGGEGGEGGVGGGGLGEGGEGGGGSA